LVGGILLWFSSFLFIYNVYRTAISAGRPLGTPAGQKRAGLEDVAAAVTST
jgi:hypothetical protein